MKVQHVEIRDFRNHEASAIDFGPAINAIFGDNGEGKTNIVEAISYLCLTKSFYANSDALVARIGSGGFDVRGDLLGDSDTRWAIHALYDVATARKTLSVNKTTVATLASVVGQFPAVILSPEQNGITFGAPAERRKFLDLAISQASKIYLEESLEYRKILRQRNKILLDAKLTRGDCSDALEPWNESLVTTGTSIMFRRKAFLDEFLPLVKEHFVVVAGKREQPGIEYVPSFPVSSWSSKDSLEKRFAEELVHHSDEERRTGTTAIGPHRDDLEFSINEKSLRKFASQGQHKTYLIALKLAEFQYLKKERRETPVLLLDDVFSELDMHRCRKLLDFCQNLGQVFITATDDKAFPQKFHWNDANRRFLVQQGRVEQNA